MKRTFWIVLAGMAAIAVVLYKRKKKLITVSAPGKVLVAGGYLVLDRRFKGLVVAVNSSFHVSISPREDNLISVESPQFIDGHWLYSFTNELTSLTGNNPFIQTTLDNCLKFISNQTNVTGIHLRILADADFYSHDGVTLENVKKTGLGSSAAMTTALVGALLAYFCDYQFNTPAQLETTDHLAQICHCLAQGKIGSGFDVSAAVYGSHLYQRFSPSLLNFSPAELIHLVSSDWDQSRIPFSLPKNIEIVLGDVNSGSNTPKMVSKVMEWRKNNMQKCENLWLELNALNEQIYQSLAELSEIDSTEYELIRSELAKKSATKRMIISKKSNLSNCHLLFQTVFEASVKARALLKKMGKLANVDIEPENQSSILYDTLNVPGVLMAGVPGAGGNDAVFCLILDKEVRPHVCSLWEKHGITPLNCHVNSKGITVAHY